jgi:hypothetical protein
MMGTTSKGITHSSAIPYFSRSLGFFFRSWGFQNKGVGRGVRGGWTGKGVLSVCGWVSTEHSV